MSSMGSARPGGARPACAGRASKAEPGADAGPGAAQRRRLIQYGLIRQRSAQARASWWASLVRTTSIPAPCWHPFSGGLPGPRESTTDRLARRYGLPVRFEVHRSTPAVHSRS
jgi:hypothetical protein